MSSEINELSFDVDKGFQQNDSEDVTRMGVAAITSIYFDNEPYLSRLEKTEGAEVNRLWWYGDTEVKTMGEKSVKARSPIKEHLVNAFLGGKYTMGEELQAIVNKQEGTSLSRFHDSACMRGSVSYCYEAAAARTFYNRTPFQLPGDPRVRISLDTELTMAGEKNWDGQTRTGDNWRRTEEDKELFKLHVHAPKKYDILELKLQTRCGQEVPKWVTDLVQSHLVEAVPKFGYDSHKKRRTTATYRLPLCDKFIHDCATLLPNRMAL
ncbi:A eukaryotic polyphosphate polymerase in complex with pyrophosphate [Suillus clintonianus]|uniref:A eukaryotic polyphosphate polymerase in complex with pyrophosphate n=1 Tax=Suillus clintonianus TaxID=1904413 RepID=UPI001B86AAAF|nr:A eukaryotic polyphosphate polymerase in complex with pyrophosphate [Suillus clintonianus]KAG2117743.1 A eukaryotic polyphosphate polymerase in complex with pyrophosphate [Suillus clintonianus]